MSYTKCSELNIGDVVKHLSRNIFGVVMAQNIAAYGARIQWSYPNVEHPRGSYNNGWDIKNETINYSNAFTSLLRVATCNQIQDLQNHYNNKTIAEKLGLNDCHPCCWKFEILIAHWLCQLSLGLSNTLDKKEDAPNELHHTGCVREGEHNLSECVVPETKVDLINQVTGRRLSELQKEMGPAFGALEFARRATGRSTAQALAAIAVAMDTPNKWVQPQDHHGTHRADAWLVNQVAEIVGKLGYKGFEFRATEIRFVPILKETKVIHETTHTEVYQPGS